MRTFLIALLLVGWAHIVSAHHAPTTSGSYKGEVVKGFFMCRDPETIKKFLMAEPGVDLTIIEEAVSTKQCTLLPEGGPIEFIAVVDEVTDVEGDSWLILEAYLRMGQRRSNRPWYTWTSPKQGV